MKKKIALLVSGLILISICLGFLWPLSFPNAITEGVPLDMLLADFYVENGETGINSTTYQFQPDSEEYSQIQEILSKYSFHRSLKTVFGCDFMSGDDAAYVLQLYSGETSIIFDGTNRVLVNDRAYRIGYWGNTTALKMMDEICDVLQRQ